MRPLSSIGVAGSLGEMALKCGMLKKPRLMATCGSVRVSSGSPSKRGLAQYSASRPLPCPSGGTRYADGMAGGPGQQIRGRERIGARRMGHPDVRPGAPPDAVKRAHLVQRPQEAAAGAGSRDVVGLGRR